MKRRRLLAFLLALSIFLSVYITVLRYPIEEMFKLPVTVVPQASVSATEKFEIRNVWKVLINSEEYLLIEYPEKVSIIDVNGYVIAEERKEEKSYIENVYDLDGDGFSEILLIKWSYGTTYELEILNYTLNITAKIEVSYPFQIKIANIDGDNCFEIVIMEILKSKPGGHVSIYVYKSDGTLIDEYNLSIEDIYKQYYALESSIIKISDVDNNGADDIIVAVSYTRYLGDGTYTNEFRTYLLLISNGTIAWKKLCDVGVFHTYLLLNSFDIDMDSRKEIILIGDTEHAEKDYDLTILVFDDDGKLIGQKHIVGIVDYVFFCDLNEDSFYDLALIYYIPSDKYYYKVIDIRGNNVLVQQEIKTGTIEGFFYCEETILTPIIVMINGSELILLRSNFSRLISREFQESNIDVISFSDINDDGFTEILLKETDRYAERYLHVLDMNGSDIYYFSVDIQFYNILVIRRSDDLIFVVYHSQGISIYKSNGDLLDHKDPASFKVPIIRGNVLYEDINYDGKKEIIIINPANIYIYDCSLHLFKSFATPIDFPELGFWTTFADINGDGLKEIVIYRSVFYATTTETGLRSELYCLSLNGSLVFKEYSINKTNYYRITAFDIDFDDKDELIVLESEYSNPAILKIRIVDNNGTAKFAFKLKEKNPDAIIAFKVVKLQEDLGIFIFTKYTWKYRISVYALNGSVLWEYTYVHYYKNKVLASLFYDIDDDGIEEFIFSSFEVNHMLRCIEIGEGELWSIELDNPNISEIIEYKEPYDYLYPIELLDGRKALEINYIIYAPKRNYLRYLIIDPNGEIVFSKWLIRKTRNYSIYSVALLPRVTYIDEKLYCVAILADYSLRALKLSKYRALIYSADKKQSETFYLLDKEATSLRIMDIDNDEKLEIILVGDLFISIYEITGR